jgi:hypothetical protein
VAKTAYDILLLDSAEEPTMIGEEGIVWTKSGSQANAITIRPSGSSMVRLSKKTLDHAIRLQGVSNIAIRGVHFQNANQAILLDNADRCLIEYNRFTGRRSEAGGSGSGTIWIGKSDSWDEVAWKEGDPNQRSEGNTIKDNLFESACVESLNSELADKMHENSKMYHGIYISRGSEGNSILHNAIKISECFGSGISLATSGYSVGNRVERNFVVKLYQEMKGNESAKWRQDEESRYAIDFGPRDYAPINTVRLNEITNNLVYVSRSMETENCGASSSTPSYDFVRPYNTLHVSPARELCQGQNGNKLSRNLAYYGTDKDDMPTDPYWLGYMPNDPYWMGYWPNPESAREKFLQWMKK